MKVSIIIINYNTFDLTRDCVRSVIEHTRAVDSEIVLVDNASTQANPDDFLQIFPEIKLVKSKINGGFAYGNNLGIEQSTGDYILLLNSDTILTEDSIFKVLTYYQQQARAGVVGCRMIFPDGQVQYTGRRFRSLGWELLDLFRFIPYLMPYRQRAGKMLGKYFRHDENKAVDWVNGAFMFFRKTILDQLPGRKLDDRFFMYGEDQLWCEQIKSLGYENYFYAGTTMIHVNSGSTDPKKQLSLRKKMMKNELEIMRLRKGKGLYYYLFAFVYCSKEYFRNLIKWMVVKTTGRLIR